MIARLSQPRGGVGGSRRGMVVSFQHRAERLEPPKDARHANHGALQ